MKAKSTLLQLSGSKPGFVPAFMQHLSLRAAKDGSTSHAGGGHVVFLGKTALTEAEGGAGSDALQ
ncbi:hypothetical protein, partial [Dysosmobacter welbionis]|uniref:hypothetical protein n=1 Tax=Dysosmobacter welbionis TaxID=2093857 RepID=UPI003A8F7365